MQQSEWNQVYQTTEGRDVSWFEDHPERSLALLAKAGAEPGQSVIDVGAGASPLLRVLWHRGYRDLTALDLSAEALALHRTRMPGAAQVNYILADLRSWQPDRRYDLWHDRAALHFLTAAEDQQRYARCLRAALTPGGHAIIATFAPDGPDRCSGQRIQPYDGARLSALLGPRFEPVATERFEHETPSGTTQRFSASVLRFTG